MSSQKTLYDHFQPSTTKPSQTSSTGQKRKSDEDPQEISGPLKKKKDPWFPGNGGPKDPKLPNLVETLSS